MASVASDLHFMADLLQTASQIWYMYVNPDLSTISLIHQTDILQNETCQPLDKNYTKIIKCDVKCIYYLDAIKSSYHYLQYIALFMMQIVSKQLNSIKQGNSVPFSSIVYFYITAIIRFNLHGYNIYK